MNITLTFTSEKHPEGTSGRFVMLGFLPPGQPNFPAPSRVFHKIVDLLQALEPAQIKENDLQQLEESLDRGRDFSFDVSTDQANSIGMLPRHA
jgi:hypothetical protein